MIKSFYKDDIIKHLAAIITYGLEKKYSFSSIETAIVSSSFVNNLEKNNYDIDLTSNDVVKEAFKLCNSIDFDISYRGLFLAESYIKLFFELNKSFEYLFLYLPLSHLIDKYNVYHEMDFSNLKNDFLFLTKKETLLRKLSKTKNIKLSEITRLTGINENSLKRYAASDSSLYGASFDVLYTLSNLFNVKSNLFVSNLAIYLDNSVYLLDKSNDDYRNFLGFYFVCFYDLSLPNKKFNYQNKMFVSEDGSFNISVISSKSSDLDVKKINELFKENDYLAIFVNDYEPPKDYSFLNNTSIMEIMVITQENVYLVKKNKTKEITDIVNRSLIVRAKSEVNSLS